MRKIRVPKIGYTKEFSTPETLKVYLYSDYTSSVLRDVSYIKIFSDCEYKPKIAIVYIDNRNAPKVGAFILSDVKKIVVLGSKKHLLEEIWDYSAEESFNNIWEQL